MSSSVLSSCKADADHTTSNDGACAEHFIACIYTCVAMDPLLTILLLVVVFALLAPYVAVDILYTLAIIVLVLWLLGFLTN